MTWALHLKKANGKKKKKKKANGKTGSFQLLNLDYIKEWKMKNTHFIEREQEMHSETVCLKAKWITPQKSQLIILINCD